MGVAPLEGAWRGVILRPWRHLPLRCPVPGPAAAAPDRDDVTQTPVLTGTMWHRPGYRGAPNHVNATSSWSDGPVACAAVTGVAAGSVIECQNTPHRGSGDTQSWAS